VVGEVVHGDDSYAQYVAAISAACAGDPAADLARTLAGRYRVEPGTVPTRSEPVPLPGCTLLAEPIPPQGAVGEVLARAARALSLRVEGFAGVPVDTLHMTVADLVSGDDYTRWRCTPGWHERFVACLRRLFAETTPPTRPPLVAELVGLGVLHGGRAVVAFVGFSDRRAYERIRAFRDRVYGDPWLRALGIERPGRFRGHVTLGYLEAAGVGGFAETLAELRRWGTVRPTFEVRTVRLYSFHDMSHYEAGDLATAI
jgi:hypothetical protein